MSARNSPAALELRCEVREKMLEWPQATHPASLPHLRLAPRVTGVEQRAQWDPEFAELA